MTAGHRQFFFASVIAFAIFVSACGSPDPDDGLSAAADRVDDEQPAANTGSVAQIDDTAETEQKYREYEAADRLPVADAERTIVGYMNFTEYYAGDQDPVFIEVRSYDDDSLIGYRLRFVGFVPLDQLAGEGSIEQIIAERYGEQQAEAQARLDEANAKLNSLSEEELGSLAEN